MDNQKVNQEDSVVKGKEKTRSNKSRAYIATVNGVPYTGQFPPEIVERIDRMYEKGARLIAQDGRVREVIEKENGPHD